MSRYTRGCCPRACPSSTWLSVTAATQPDPVVHHAGGCGPFGCYPACEGHELPQHGATEARVLSTPQLQCRQDTLELHVGSLQQDGSNRCSEQSCSEDSYSLPGPCILTVSALLGHGLDKLKATLEESVLQATGWRCSPSVYSLGDPSSACTTLCSSPCTTLTSARFPECTTVVSLQLAVQGGQGVAGAGAAQD
ncbi:uncharacterized protein LOC101983118 isoform X3 [Microtus ochrogaster]|uniref:Uncharacterized protein LOC101983118 isoform X3 n=1 Tax=Microtus ochrogaster TaxID=79684 RepID=A0ABM1UV57_MICOH|nr:uncharacterized protein LOC101983118 isoform X3 [Microtus ochrogaster]XP_026645870.1 uncharacterized protein LOC101983118 isoform X3 [Microtus ochrogaster]